MTIRVLLLAVAGIIAAVGPARASPIELQGKPSFVYYDKAGRKDALTIDDVMRKPEQELRTFLMESVLPSPCKLRSNREVENWKKNTVRAVMAMGTRLYNDEELVVVGRDSKENLREVLAAMQRNVAIRRKMRILWDFRVQLEDVKCMPPSVPGTAPAGRIGRGGY
jgi:hypothetical protein